MKKDGKPHAAGGQIRKAGRRTSNAPTISDVADEAGCSPMTVSRVINGSARVSDAARQAVNDAIKKLSYSPNPAARSLAGVDPIRVALLYSNPSAAYLSELLVGSLEPASSLGIQLIVEKCHYDVDEEKVARRLINGRVDGFILPAPLCEEQSLLDIISAAGVPAVAIGPGTPMEGVSSICIDDYQAARDMTKHILDLGHTKIGFIIGNPFQKASAERLRGFADQMQDAGIAVPKQYVVQGRFTYRSGLEAASRLLDLTDPPTAIFASNDDMAAAVVAIAHRKHLDVPAELTVCGFDDTSIASTIWPELTTIHQPIAAMSKSAVDLIVREIQERREKKKPAKSSSVFLDYTLVKRHSDAAPTLSQQIFQPKGNSR